MRWFNMRQPCRNCPFRSDITPYLNVERVQGIIEDLVKRGLSFQCHKTLPHNGPRAMFCAGAMILLEKNGVPNQAMQIGERLSCFDPSGLDLQAPVYDTPEQMLDAHRKEGTWTR